MTNWRKDYAANRAMYDETRRAAMSNQSTLNNGCVCDSGCEACGRLAEVFEARGRELENLTAILSSLPAGRNYQEAIQRARRALADKVSR